MRARDNEAGLAALIRLWRVAGGNHGPASRIAAAVLLCLHDGARFPLDLRSLRILEGRDFEDVLTLLATQWNPTMEVHEWLNRLYNTTDFAARLEHLACQWRLPGARPAQAPAAPPPLPAPTGRAAA